VGVGRGGGFGYMLGGRFSFVFAILKSGGVEEVVGGGFSFVLFCFVFISLHTCISPKVLIFFSNKSKCNVNC